MRGLESVEEVEERTTNQAPWCSSERPTVLTVGSESARCRKSLFSLAPLFSSKFCQNLCKTRSSNVPTASFSPQYINTGSFRFTITKTSQVIETSIRKKRAQAAIFDRIWRQFSSIGWLRIKYVGNVQGCSARTSLLVEGKACTKDYLTVRVWVRLTFIFPWLFLT